MSYGFILMIFLNGTYVEVPYRTMAECERARDELSEAQAYQTEQPPTGFCVEKPGLPTP